MADIRTWTPESDVLKPGEPCSVQEIRSWFERLPRMRALIRQQQEHIESLRSAATTTTSSNSGAPGHSGTSDKVGTNSDAAMDAETKLAELKCQYAEMLTGEIPLSILNDDEAMLNYDFNFSYTKVNRLKAFSDPVNLGN